MILSPGSWIATGQVTGLARSMKSTKACLTMTRIQPCCGSGNDEFFHICLVSCFLSCRSRLQHLPALMNVRQHFHPNAPARKLGTSKACSQDDCSSTIISTMSGRLLAWTAHGFTWRPMHLVVCCGHSLHVDLPPAILLLLWSASKHAGKEQNMNHASQFRV